MVVRRSTDDVLVASLNDQQMSVLNTRDEPDTLTTLFRIDGGGKFFIQIINEYAGIICFQITTVMSYNLTVF